MQRLALWDATVPRGNRSRRCLRQRSDRLNIDRYYRIPYKPIKVLRQVADSFAVNVQKGGGVAMVLDVRPSLPFSCPRSRFEIRGKLGVWVCRSAPVDNSSRIDGMIQVVLFTRQYILVQRLRNSKYLIRFPAGLEYS